MTDAFDDASADAPSSLELGIESIDRNGFVFGYFRVGAETIPIEHGIGGAEVPGLCLARNDKGGPVARGRSSPWNFRFLWLLARIGGIEVNRSDFERPSAATVSLANVARLPALERPDRAARKTTKDPLRSLTNSLRQYGPSRVGGTPTGSHIVATDYAVSFLRLKPAIDVRLVAPPDLQQDVDVLLLADAAPVLAEARSARQVVRAIQTRTAVVSNDEGARSSPSHGAPGSVSAVVTPVIGAEWASIRRPEVSIERDANRDISAQGLAALLEKPRVVVIRASAGCGKTTLLASAFTEWVATHGSGVFVQCDVETKDWARDPSEKLARLLASQPQTWIRSAREQGHLPAFFFDTLDVVLSARSGRSFVELMKTLVDLGVGVVFSCRTVDFTPWSTAAESYGDLLSIRVVELPPFSRTEVNRFVRCFAELHVEAAASETFVHGIVPHVERTGFRAVFSIPLFLSLICATCARGRRVPDVVTFVTLFEIVYAGKVRAARHAIPRSDEPSDRELACARVSESMLKNSGETLQVWASPFAEAVNSERVRAAVDTLVSEGIFERSAFGIRYFHQSFAEYMIGRLLNADAELGRTYLQRFAAHPAANHWLAPILRFALVLGGRRAIADAVRVLPLDDELALRPLFLAMAEEAPELLLPYVARAHTRRQRTVLAEALASLDVRPGFDATRELLALTRWPDHDEASILAMRAVAARVAAAEDPVAAARQALFDLRERCPNPQAPEETLITTLASEPHGKAILAGLNGMLSTFAGVSRWRVAQAVAEVGSPTDFEQVMGLFVTTDMPHDLVSVSLVLRHLANGFRGTPEAALDAIRTILVRFEPATFEGALVASLAAVTAIRGDSQEITAAIVVAALDLESPSSEMMRSVLACMSRAEDGAKLVWRAVRSLDTWWERADARRICEILVDALKANPELRFDELGSAEQVAINAVALGRLPGHGGKPSQSVAELHRELAGSDYKAASRACDELISIIEANPALDVVELLRPALRSPCLYAKAKALALCRQLPPPAAIELLAMATIEEGLPDGWHSALAVLRDRAADADRETRSSYLTLRWLSLLGSKLRANREVPNRSPVICAWLGLWRDWLDLGLERESDHDAWRVFELEITEIDIGPGQEGGDVLAVVLRRFFMAEPERAFALANRARELPTANVVAMIRGTRDVDAASEVVLALLAHDDRDEVRRFVSRVRLGMGQGTMSDTPLEAARSRWMDADDS